MILEDATPATLVERTLAIVNARRVETFSAAPLPALPKGRYGNSAYCPIGLAFEDCIPDAEERREFVQKLICVNREVGAFTSAFDRGFISELEKR